MVQLLGRPDQAARAYRRVPERALSTPPEVVPPAVHERHLVWGALLFVGAILAIATVTSAMASGGLFAVVIIATALAVTLLLLRRPSARRPTLRRMPPDEIGATPEQIDRLTRR